MALNSTQSRAIAFIDEIHTLSRSRQFPLMITKINNFSIYLYNNSSVIYSNINKYFYQIGLVPILMNYCIYVSHEVAKDILRLLHIFIKTNKKIKDDVSNSNDFMQYLSTVLNSEETWNNTTNFKYHIHIGAYLLMESEIKENFNTSSILRIIREKIELKNYSNNILIYIICYSCLIPISNFDSITDTFKETSLERFFSTTVMKTFVSIVENYISEFKIIYNQTGNTIDQYSFFHLESEFTFEQICHSLSYYSRQSEQICINISDNGIYKLINEIFQIKNIPGNLILKSLQFVSISSSYFQNEEKYKENDQIFVSVNNNKMTSESFSEDNKYKTEQIVSSCFSNESKSLDNIVDNSINEIQTISSFEPSITTINQSMKSNDFGKSFNVVEWLNYNKLDYFENPFTALSGKGLYQMKNILHCPGGRMKMFQLLFINMNIDIVYILEFLECLDNLNII